MYICREMTDLSLVAIGKQFGDRDHSTVLHSIRKISDLVVVDPSFGSRVRGLMKKLSV